jgi:anti-sigma-K factor RskA
MSDDDRNQMPGEHDGHARWEDDAAAYALGALAPDEADAFQRHLETCAACRLQLTALQPLIGALPLAAEQYEVPPGLRRRVIEQAHAEAGVGAGAGARPVRRVRLWPPRPGLAGALLAGVAAVLVVGIVLLSGGGGTRVFTSSVGHAKLYVSPDRATLVVHQLALPKAGDVYEAWLLHPHRPPTPAGLFGVSQFGSGRVRLHGGLRGVSAVAVTEEPAPGTPAPTHTPVIITPIS